MPTLRHSVPKYRKHRASGRAVVTIAGKDHYLGPWKSKASKIEYGRLIGEWLAAGRPAASNSGSPTITIGQPINRFRKWATSYYTRDGKQTGTAENFRFSLRILRNLYGHLPVDEFRPLSLESIQKQLADEGNTRRWINDSVSRIKLVFKWGVANELVPVEVVQRLDCVRNLQKGRSTAKDSPPIEPVADNVVEQTIKHLPAVVADMVRFQRPSTLDLVGKREPKNENADNGQ
jgi:hypothetical protein